MVIDIIFSFLNFRLNSTELQLEQEQRRVENKLET